MLSWEQGQHRENCSYHLHCEQTHIFFPLMVCCNPSLGRLHLRQIPFCRCLPKLWQKTLQVFFTALVWDIVAGSLALLFLQPRPRSACLFLKLKISLYLPWHGSYTSHRRSSVHGWMSNSLFKMEDKMEALLHYYLDADVVLGHSF